MTPAWLRSVVHGLNDIKVSDGDMVAPALIPRALTAGELVFSDHATQVFEADGGTTYVENGRPTRGEWYVDDNGRFGSFWPPSYRASYDLRWIVEDGVIVGLRFTELGRGSRFDGRYRN
jgi:hypothetical protein